LLQEEGLFPDLWDAVNLSPQRSHIIFLSATYNHSPVEIFVDWSFPKKTNKKEKAEPLLALP